MYNEMVTKVKNEVTDLITFWLVSKIEPTK